MNPSDLNIIITGVGGQGNVTLSRLIGEIIVDHNEFVTIGETFGASQRGGSVMSHLRISQTDLISPVIPANKGNLVIGLEPLETLRVLISYGNPEVRTISNTWTVMPASVLSGDSEYPEEQQLTSTIKSLSKISFLLNFTEMGIQMGHHLLSNSIIIGLVSGLEIIKGLEYHNFKRIIETHYTDKLLRKNIEAFEKGFKISENLNFQFH